jgi:hypothetical protein
MTGAASELALASAMTLVPIDVVSALRKLPRVRNTFARNLAASFGEQVAHDLCHNIPTRHRKPFDAEGDYRPDVPHRVLWLSHTLMLVIVSGIVKHRREGRTASAVHSEMRRDAAETVRRMFPGFEGMLSVDDKLSARLTAKKAAVERNVTSTDTNERSVE